MNAYSLEGVFDNALNMLKLKTAAKNSTPTTTDANGVVQQQPQRAVIRKEQRAEASASYSPQAGSTNTMRNVLIIGGITLATVTAVILIRRAQARKAAAK